MPMEDSLMRQAARRIADDGKTNPIVRPVADEDSATVAGISERQPLNCRINLKEELAH